MITGILIGIGVAVVALGVPAGIYLHKLAKSFSDADI